jgi:hypothetical protein
MLAGADECVGLDAVQNLSSKHEHTASVLTLAIAHWFSPPLRLDNVMEQWNDEDPEGGKARVLIDAVPQFKVSVVGCVLVLQPPPRLRQHTPCHGAALPACRYLTLAQQSSTQTRLLCTQPWTTICARSGLRGPPSWLSSAARLEGLWSIAIQGPRSTSIGEALECLFWGLLCLVGR